jgi:hypothetical protein
VRRIAAVTAALTLAAAPLAAECADPIATLRPLQGSIQRGARCGAFVIATDGAATQASFARVVIPAPLPYRLTVQARRLSGDSAAPIEIELQGGYFLWRDGGWAIYFSEPQFARDGWHPVPGLDSRRDHQVEVDRSTRAVTVRLDGVALGTWPLDVQVGDGPTLALAGRRGSRARALVRRWSVAPLAP